MRPPARLRELDRRGPDPAAPAVHERRAALGQRAELEHVQEHGEDTSGSAAACSQEKCAGTGSALPASTTTSSA